VAKNQREILQEGKYTSVVLVKSCYDFLFKCLNATRVWDHRKYRMKKHIDTYTHADITHICTSYT